MWCGTRIERGTEECNGGRCPVRIMTADVTAARAFGDPALAGEHEDRV